MNQEYVSLVVETSLAAEDEVQGYFLMNHDVQGFEEGRDGELIVHLLKEEWDNEKAASLEAFLHGLPSTGARLLEIKTQKDTDWNAQWEAGIEPLKISDDLVISPSWRLEEAKQLAPKHLIVIDPKMSFGTGHHETTRLCLAMLEKIDCGGKSVLDLGSGTGILAMYAMMRGATHAVAVDTDEWAYNNAKENCERNGFTNEKIEVRMGDLSSSVKPDEMFDLLIANIHRNVLLAIGADIAKHQKAGGSLILSGILEYDADEIILEYRENGYSLRNTLQETEWVSFLFERE
jgi:ribosomal protein L11 methyltransferase